MKRAQMNSILVEEVKKRNTIIIYIFLIVICFVIGFTSIITYINKNSSYQVSYDENSKVDYKVFLKENDYFDDAYLTNKNTYIASLIDYIKANFNYKLTMSEENVDYRYSYKIEANVTVTEINGSKPLYDKSNILKEVSEQVALYDNEVEINENIDIDYNEYNNLINKFITLYELEEIDSKLTINMYVNVLGSCEKFTEYANDETVISLVIPLTTKTVGIDIKNDLVEENDGVVICRDASPLIIVFLFVSIVMCLVIIYLIYKLVRYIIETRSPATMYDIELKKILNYYHSYIQKVSNNMDFKDVINYKDENTKERLQKFVVDDKTTFKGCQFFKMESFTDMLEIRDNLNAPILMSSNDDNTATYFIIADLNNRAVYIYELRVDHFDKKKSKNNN